MKQKIRVVISMMLVFVLLFAAFPVQAAIKTTTGFSKISEQIYVKYGIRTSLNNSVTHATDSEVITPAKSATKAEKVLALAQKALNKYPAEFFEDTQILEIVIADTAKAIISDNVWMNSYVEIDPDTEDGFILILGNKATEAEIHYAILLVAMVMAPDGNDIFDWLSEAAFEMGYVREDAKVHPAGVYKNGDADAFLDILTIGAGVMMREAALVKQCAYDLSLRYKVGVFTTFMNTNYPYSDGKYWNLAYNDTFSPGYANAIYYASINQNVVVYDGPGVRYKRGTALPGVYPVVIKGSKWVGMVLDDGLLYYVRTSDAKKTKAPDLKSVTPANLLEPYGIKLIRNIKPVQGKTLYNLPSASAELKFTQTLVKMFDKYGKPSWAKRVCFVTLLYDVLGSKVTARDYDRVDDVLIFDAYCIVTPEMFERVYIAMMAQYGK